tara:strand:- start:5742 stop:7784 length:2043 start_codon:yes stop_codon:yes gene_type:complete
MASLCYSFTRCDGTLNSNGSPYWEYAFGNTTIINIGKVYSIYGHCYTAYSLLPSFQGSCLEANPPLVEYNNCNECENPPSPTPVGPVYGWRVNVLQGSGSNVKPTSCAYCNILVYATVANHSDIVCGNATFYNDSGLTSPFQGSNQYYSALPAPNAEVGQGTGLLLLANGGVVTDKFDCQGNSNCANDCFQFTISNTSNPLDDDSFTYIDCSGSPVSSNQPYGGQQTVCAKSFTHEGVALTITNTLVNCNTPVPIAPPSPTPVPTPVPVPTPTPVPVAPTPQHCLQTTNAVTVQEVNGVNSYFFGETYGVYGSGTGIFVLTNVPIEHPIAFQNHNLTSKFSYTGQYSIGSKQGLDGQTYEYFYGDVTITVTGDYGLISYECYYHGYMGGQNNLAFDDFTCPNIAPPIVPPLADPSLLYTLTYSDSVQGWPSFYSYYPDYMIGMNNYFYSFKNGELYRHNTNPVRNNYYNVQYNSQITSVFNQQPLENKIFKTLNLESDSSWSATLDSDIQTGNSIDATYFEKKEGAWFAYVRSNGSLPADSKEYSLRSTNGIGRSTSVSPAGNLTTINFSTDPLIDIGSDLSIGDMVYFSLSPYNTIQLAGQVVGINRDLPTGENNIIINTSIPNSNTIPIQDAYIAYIKNQEAESYGLLGHYCLFTLTNTNSTATELFAVESEVMKSYP